MKKRWYDYLWIASSVYMIKRNFKIKKAQKAKKD